MKEYHLANEQETEAFAETVLGKLSHRKDRATIITLSGELGAGKTTFARGFAKALGIGETIQSPTFILAKFYSVDRAWPKQLVHIDAYRLNGPKELSALNMDSIMNDPGNVVLLEWPEQVAPLPISPDMTLSFSVIPDGRRLTIE